MNLKVLLYIKIDSFFLIHKKKNPKTKTKTKKQKTNKNQNRKFQGSLAKIWKIRVFSAKIRKIELFVILTS